MIDRHDQRKNVEGLISPHQRTKELVLQYQVQLLFSQPEIIILRNILNMILVHSEILETQEILHFEPNTPSSIADLTKIRVFFFV